MRRPNLKQLRQLCDLVVCGRPGLVTLHLELADLLLRFAELGCHSLVLSRELLTLQYELAILFLHVAESGFRCFMLSLELDMRKIQLRLFLLRPDRGTASVRDSHR